MTSDFSRAPRTPLIEVTELTQTRVSFTLSNANTAMANALRRIMIAEVPTLAIELVTVLDNTSVLHDEFIAHRLGLLPIDSTRIRDFKYKEECSCADRCRSCCVEFSLDVMCRDQDGFIVTHLDIVAGSPMPVPRAEEAPNNSSGGIAIAKLRKNQRLKCELVATKGIGKLHAKWTPAATAVFQYEPEIILNDKLLETVPPNVQQEIAMSCPHQVFSCDHDPFTPPTLSVQDKMLCIFCDECIVTAKEKGYPDLIRVTQKTDVFRFVVESTGSLPAPQIIEMAFEVLDKKLKEILTCTSKLEGFTSEEAAAAAASVGEPRSHSRKQRDSRRDHPSSAWNEDFILDLA